MAAFAVVVNHYHHFYLVDAYSRGALPDVSEFPYARWLELIYRHGDKAVELFWIISGFVFMHVYGLRGAELRSFAAARIARLYPLHLVTLLIVAAIQYVSLCTTGHWQIYGNNDLRHFLLQLGLASNWNTLSFGLSFNGPIWSVSLEIVAYALFFLFLPLLRRYGLAAAIIATGLAFAIGRVSDLSLLRPGAFECAGYFFTGVCIYTGLRRMQGRGAKTAAVVGLGLAAAASRFGHVDLTILLTGSALVLFTAGLDLSPRPTSTGGWLTGLGDMSYSVYLVHVPLQMMILLGADALAGGTRAFADHPLLLPAYLALVLIVAWPTYVYFERPAGRMIRRALMPSERGWGAKTR